jgi:hypothetical protein
MNEKMTRESYSMQEIDFLTGLRLFVMQTLHKVCETIYVP